MAPYKALYGRRCHSPTCCVEVGERKLLGPELIQITTEKVKLIQDRLRIAQIHQQSYIDNRHRQLEFQRGDYVFLRVSAAKGLIRFGKKGKLSPRYIGPFEILERIRAVSYKISLPHELSSVNNVFHVSMINKYVPDPAHILSHEPLQVREDLSYIEHPREILDHKDQILRTNVIPLVKVLWHNHSIEEATLEQEDEIKERYPHLFGN